MIPARTLTVQITPRFSIEINLRRQAAIRQATALLAIITLDSNPVLLPFTQVAEATILWAGAFLLRARAPGAAAITVVVAGPTLLTFLLTSRMRAPCAT
jgi:hypothetical protein